MQIKINNKKYKTENEETIFGVCARNKIKIPGLCGMKDFHEGVCRICVVECGGRLMTSCNTEIREGMEIITESENISRARRINLELLWADHAGKCATCKKKSTMRVAKIGGGI